MPQSLNINQVKKELWEAKSQTTAKVALRDEAKVERSADAMDQIQGAEAREFALLSLDRYARQLRQIEAALQRVNAGDYGICLDCDGEIGLKRLRAVPWAERCVKCQEHVDQHGPTADRIDFEPVSTAA